ncbi:MAG: flagellar basal body rod protein FlgB [Pseudomonadota bacterium]
MPNLDSALGMHEVALKLRAQRMEILSSNMANADTPNYKARDLDFRAVLSDYQSGNGPSSSGGLRTTHARHLGANSGGLGGEALYRNPLQPSVDGNTVDPQVEKSKFMENAMQYQATLSFIDGRVKGLRKAIKGE